MPDRDEKRRRKLIVAASFAMLFASLACALPDWWHQPQRSIADLAFQAIPLASASAFVIGLCVGYPPLFPWPRLTPVTMLTVPAMHVALLVAISALLAARPSALLAPLPGQKQIQIWLDPKMWLAALCAEVALFLVAVVLSTVLRQRRPC